MAKGDHKFRGRPKGSTNGGYTRPRVQIGFTEKQMKEISRIAKAEKKSFAALVRDLIDESIYMRTLGGLEPRPRS